MLEVPFGPSLWTHLVALIPKPFVRRAVVPNSQNVVAIVCRDEQGVWRRVPSTKTKEGDELRLLPTARGIVAVLGTIRDEDHSAILRLIEGFEVE